MLQLENCDELNCQATMPNQLVVDFEADFAIGLRSTNYCLYVDVNGEDLTMNNSIVNGHLTRSFLLPNLAFGLMKSTWQFGLFEFEANCTTVDAVVYYCCLNLDYLLNLQLGHQTQPDSNHHRNLNSEIYLKYVSF